MMQMRMAPPDQMRTLVMGGTAQTTWEHCVPKCAYAGPRISVMFREPFVY